MQTVERPVPTSSAPLAMRLRSVTWNTPHPQMRNADELEARLREIGALGYPVLVGASRKSTLGMLLGGSPPEDRLEGTAAVSAIAIANGAAIIRVHDVRFMARLARVAHAVAHGI